MNEQTHPGMSGAGLDQDIDHIAFRPVIYDPHKQELHGQKVSQ